MTYLNWRRLVRRPCFQAVTRMSLANETRERALKELQTPLKDLKVKDLAVLTGETKWLTELSIKLGMPLSTMLDTLWSSEVTDYRAAAMVEAAAQDIAQEFAEREAKRKAKQGRRR